MGEIGTPFKKKKCYRVRSTVIEMEKVRSMMPSKGALFKGRPSSQAEEVMQGMQRSRNQNGEEGDVRVSECHSFTWKLHIEYQKKF